MAGHARDRREKASTKGVGDTAIEHESNQRTRRRRTVRREVFGELVRVAADQGHPIELGVSTADALQGCLDRSVSLFRLAASKVDLLPEDELFELRISPNGSSSEVPNKWITLETEMRQEVERLAGMMTQLGIAERSVRIQEAQAALLVASIRDAAIEAGIPHDQVRALGAALRNRIESASTSISPSPKESSSAKLAQTSATGAEAGVMGPGHGIGA